MVCFHLPKWGKKKTPNKTNPASFDKTCEDFFVWPFCLFGVCCGFLWAAEGGYVLFWFCFCFLIIIFVCVWFSFLVFFFGGGGGEELFGLFVCLFENITSNLYVSLSYFFQLYVTNEIVTILPHTILIDKHQLNVFYFHILQLVYSK